MKLREMEMQAAATTYLQHHGNLTPPLRSARAETSSAGSSKLQACTHPSRNRVTTRTMTTSKRSDRVSRARSSIAQMLFVLGVAACNSATPTPPKTIVAEPAQLPPVKASAEGVRGPFALRAKHDGFSDAANLAGQLLLAGSQRVRVLPSGREVPIPLDGYCRAVGTVAGAVIVEDVHTLCAVDASPAVRWCKKFEGSITAHVRGAHLFARVAESPDRSRIVALDPATGNLVWQRTTASQNGWAPTRDAVALHEVGDALYGLDPQTGAIRWTKRPAGQVWILRDAFAGGPHHVALIGRENFVSSLLLLDASDGTIVGHRRAEQPPGLIVATYFDEDDLFLFDGVLLRLSNGTAEELWRLPATLAGPISRASDGYLFAAADRLRLLAHDTGEEKWSAPVPGIPSQPRELRIGPERVRVVGSSVDDHWSLFLFAQSTDAPPRTTAVHP